MRFKRFGFAAVAAMFVVSGAYAQTAAPATPDAAATDAATTKVKAKVKPKAKPAEAKTSKAKKLPFVTVTVKNGRAAGLTLLTATISGGTGDPVKVAGALASGKSATAHLAHEKDCLFDLHGDFADGATTDETAVNLCKDKKINLVE